jgi:hypothetical protein
MLLIPTFLGPSKIDGAGIGVFTQCVVNTGDAIWRFDDRIDRLLTARAVESLPDAAKEFVYHHGCQCRDDLWLLCGDNAQFINHAVPGVTACNLGASLDAENIALQRVGFGEELTEDYGRYALDFQRRGFFKGPSGDPSVTETSHTQAREEVMAAAHALAHGHGLSTLSSNVDRLRRAVGELEK